MEAEGEPSEEDEGGEEDGEGLRPLQEDGDGGDGGGGGWRGLGDGEGGALLVELEAGPSRVCHGGQQRGISHSPLVQRQKGKVESPLLQEYS